jgi:hypothetical protein
MNLIERENAFEGSRDWQLTRVKTDGGLYRSSAIEGYCSRQSVKAGDTLDIMVSVQPAAQFTIEIFRMGYYGGRGARLMKTIGPLSGAAQPVPKMNDRRLQECNWKPSTTITIPPDWTSGVYLGRLTRITTSELEAPWQSYVVFIVTDDGPADVLFQCSDNTWNAYNRWPTKHSLYDTATLDWGSPYDVDVSFDRPYGKYRQIYDNPMSTGSGEFLCWEFPLAYWLEQHGYDVTYCSNSDMVTPQRALKCKTFISVGHDEYWDIRQHDSLKKCVNEGVTALFLSGNTLCWVSPLRESSTGVPNRILHRAGPYGGFSSFRDARNGQKAEVVGPDEGLLMGARNVVPVNGGGDWVCAKPEHWIFENTGMKKGDRIPGLVGWEYHGSPADLPGLEVVGEGTAFVGGVKPQRWTATYHPGPKGNFVFNAATIFWAQGLGDPPGHMLPWSHWSRPHGPDRRVQQITHNLLRRAIAGGKNQAT